MRYKVHLFIAGYVLAALLIVYLFLGFSELGFNYAKWSSLGRLLFNSAFVAGIGIFYCANKNSKQKGK